MTIPQQEHSTVSTDSVSPVEGGTPAAITSEPLEDAGPEQVAGEPAEPDGSDDDMLIYAAAYRLLTRGR